MKPGTLLLAFLSGCTAISHRDPPSDFPELATTAHFVSTREMRDHCQRSAGLGQIAEACAHLNFAERTCVIWLNRDFVSWSVIEHELDHCKGKDHMGGSVLADAWARWKSMKGKP